MNALLLLSLFSLSTAYADPAAEFLREVELTQRLEQAACKKWKLANPADQPDNSIPHVDKKAALATLKLMEDRPKAPHSVRAADMIMDHTDELLKSLGAEKFLVQSGQVIPDCEPLLAFLYVHKLIKDLGAHKFSKQETSRLMNFFKGYFLARSESGRFSYLVYLIQMNTLNEFLKVTSNANWKKHSAEAGLLYEKFEAEGKIVRDAVAARKGIEFERTEVDAVKSARSQYGAFVKKVFAN
mgnify:CR=1